MSGPAELELCRDCYELADEMVPGEVIVEIDGERMLLCTVCADEWEKVAAHDGSTFVREGAK